MNAQERQRWLRIHQVSSGDVMKVLPNDTSCETETRDVVLTTAHGRYRITETAVGLEVMLLPTTVLRRISVLAAIGQASNVMLLREVAL
jgi:hypothetical protein